MELTFGHRKAWNTVRCDNADEAWKDWAVTEAGYKGHLYDLISLKSVEKSRQIHGDIK